MNPQVKRATWSLYLSIVSLLLAVIALVIIIRDNPAHKPSDPSQTSLPGLLERIDKTGELHAGYGVYPPYTMEDPNTKAISGLSIDIVNQIALELRCRVVWHRLNWTTMSADLKRGEFDVIADPIFQTIPRAREFAFSEPYAYFADGIAVVRKSDTRFTRFTDLDSKGIRLSVGQGWASEALVRSRFTKSDIQSVQTTTDLLQVFNGVLSGRADVAVTDEADAVRFVGEHATEVKALFLNDPPAYSPAGFALRPDDRRGADFLSVSIRNLSSTGVLQGLASRYKLPANQIAPPRR